MSSTVTSKGQVTIPKSVRERLGIIPGNAIEFQLADDGRVILTKAGEPAPRTRFANLLGRAGPGLSTDEIMALMRGEGE